MERKRKNLAQYLLKLDTFTEEQFHRADMDENSSANVIDLALLKKSLMK